MLDFSIPQEYRHWEQTKWSQDILPVGGPIQPSILLPLSPHRQHVQPCTRLGNSRGPDRDLDQQLVRLFFACCRQSFIQLLCLRGRQCSAWWDIVSHGHSCILWRICSTFSIRKREVKYLSSIISRDFTWKGKKKDGLLHFHSFG